MIVELHSDVLLHVSDLFARGVENKLGLLLGYGLDDRLVVVKPIELHKWTRSIWRNDIVCLKTFTPIFPLWVSMKLEGTIRIELIS